MPDIVPTNTEVLVCAGVPLDNKYNDTILFTSAGAQQGYFRGKAKYSYTGHFTYQRVQNKVNNYSSLQSLPNPRIEFSCRIPVNADKIYDCNYLCFCNKYDTNKWWYCFIKEINYINPNCCEIIYEIDAIQTFLFDFHVQKSFVEREHTATDNVFEYVCLEDDVASGEYVLEAVKKLIGVEQGDPYIILCVAASETANQLATDAGLEYINPSPSHLYIKFSGVGYYATKDERKVRDYFDAMDEEGKANEIYYIFNINNLNGLRRTGVQSIEFFNNITPTTFIGYEPHNKMLLSYPFRKFNFFAAGAGKPIELHPNLWLNGTNFAFVTYVIFTGDTLLYASRPYEYDYLSDSVTPELSDRVNLDKTVMIDSAVPSAWSSDAYQNWLAQNKGSLIAQAISGLVNTGVGLTAMGINIGGGNALGATYGAQNAGQGIRDITSAITRITDAKHLPDNMHGSIGSTDFNYSTGEVGVWIESYRLDNKSIKRIDEYFTRYGYKVNEIKIPTPFDGHKRPKFNYVKTVDVNITGSVPTPQMNIIKSAFDSGITFWHDPQNVGVYGEGENDV